MVQDVKGTGARIATVVTGTSSWSAVIVISAPVKRVGTIDTELIGARTHQNRTSPLEQAYFSILRSSIENTSN